MKGMRTRGAAIFACAAALSLGAGMTPAAADDDPHVHSNSGLGRVEWLNVEYDPYLSPDALVTDSQEAQIPPGTDTSGCTWESAQTSPSPVPASPSFQLLYVLPYGLTPTNHLDVPRSCADNSVRIASLSRTSRNVASWLAAQGAGLNYRTATINYTHNFTGATYPTRGVRRLRSAYTQSEWNSIENSTGPSTSPRLSRLRAEMNAAGWTTVNTKYIALLDAATTGWNCTTTCKSHSMGVAMQNGTHALTTRYYTNTSPRVYIRYGCATDGDAILAHEMTHLLNAGHVTDAVDDLMAASKSQAHFNSGSPTMWDYARDNYHTIVRSSPWVGLSSQPGNYYTC